MWNAIAAYKVSLFIGNRRKIFSALFSTNFLSKSALWRPVVCAHEFIYTYLFPVGLFDVSYSKCPLPHRNLANSSNFQLGEGRGGRVHIHISTVILCLWYSREWCDCVQLQSSPTPTSFLRASTIYKSANLWSISAIAIFFRTLILKFKKLILMWC